jgi:signal transduction histidine kinase
MIDDLVTLGDPPLERETQLERRPIDLVELGRRAAAEYERVRGSHQIRMTVTDRRIVGLWDPTHLVRVFDNLLGNALKYSPGGGQIVLHLSREKDAAGEWAVLAVRDMGMGIPRADLPRVFEPYYRGENAQLIAGTGIGLASVKESVEKHGGVITVASEEGRGSTFTVRLPIEKARAVMG